MYNLIRMFVVVSLENKLHFIFPRSCYKWNTTWIKSRLNIGIGFIILSKLCFRFEKEIYWASMDESAKGSFAAVIFKNVTRLIQYAVRFSKNSGS